MESDQDMAPSEYRLTVGEWTCDGTIQGATLEEARELLVEQAEALMAKCSERSCAYGDPLRPCQDGDPCHYQATKKHYGHETS